MKEVQLQSKIIKYNAPNFSQTIDNLTHNDCFDQQIQVRISQIVRKIITNIVKERDKALLRYSKEFDNFIISENNIRVSKEQIDKAYNDLSDSLRNALNVAKIRIESFHRQQMPKDLLYKDKEEVTLGTKWNVIDSVGIYVPGGTASYPSSVLMNVIPAQVAGVKRIAMVTPPTGGKINDVVLAAAKIADIDEIYQIGGAQAIAALAYGTNLVQSVNKIVGPGNAYVAEAKRQVFGKVGIDMIAGPSEIMIIAEDNANPEWVAIDLLAQAEHDIHARSILVVDNEDFARKIEYHIHNYLNILARKEIALQSWEANGCIFIVKDLELDAIAIANKIAPEHLELMVNNPDNYQKNINNAGAIFIGDYTPEAIGDYIAGPSHVLPTSGSAKFSSGLTVYDFIKKTSIINCSKDSFQKIGKYAYEIAISEGLTAHAKSIDIRFNK